MIPVVLATIRCMKEVVRSGELAHATGWLRLLWSSDVVFLTAGVLIFDWVVEN